MNRFLEHTTSNWIHYDQYEWLDTPDGQRYLLPTPGAKPGAYDPIKEAENLVLSAMDIGLMLFRQEPEEKVQESIKQFACKYGLFGIMTALPTTANFVEYEKVYFPHNQLIRAETMETKEYIRLFFPFHAPDFSKKGVESVWNVSDRAMLPIMMTHRNDPQAMVMSFMRDYGEPYEWLASTIKDWTFTLITATLYYNDKDELDEETLDLYRKGMSAFEGNAPTYHLELRERPTMVWDFHSLMLNIKFLFSLMLTDENNPLQICKQCQKPFIASEATADFCSSSCNQKYKGNPKI